MVLAELPGEWAAAVRDWSARQHAPDANLGYLAWQTLVGAWPLSAERASAYLHKAAREAKQHTTWADPDEAYETALADFVTSIYADEALLADIDAFVTRIGGAGRSNSLAQKLVQLTMPGVPDVYQGSELWDLSLVDPDNRRPVDFASRSALLARLDAGTVAAVDEVGLAKLQVVAQALRLRAERADVFAGSYDPLTATGAAAGHVLAFARAGAVVTVATRLPVGLQRVGGWQGTALALPPGTWTDRLSGRACSGEVRLGDLLAALPVALLGRG